MKIALLGTGNVGSHLAKGLSGRHEIVQIYSRTLSHANALAEAIGCESVTDDIDCVTDAAEVYILTVKDDALPTVIDKSDINRGIWLHTAGSVPMEAFAGKKEHYGVLYPMQSFSKAIEVDWHDVPVFVEWNDDETGRAVKEIAGTLTEKVQYADSAMRKRLHIAAVFSCNFANHLWALASEVLEDGGIGFDSMMPLIRTTVDKLKELSPRDSQTGPAVREDYEVMRNHLEILGKGQKYDIYKTLSESIIETKKKKE